MSCADVCIDMGYDEDNDFHDARVRRARREHRCGECKRTIRKGESYEHVAGKSDGAIWTAKTCAECLAIRQALVCGTWFYSMLWEAIKESVFETWLRTGPYDCLAKIESRAARDVLMQHFDEWRADRGGTR